MCALFMSLGGLFQSFFFQPVLGRFRSCRMYFYAERRSGRKATDPPFGGHDRYVRDTNYEYFSAATMDFFLWVVVCRYEVGSELCN